MIPKLIFFDLDGTIINRAGIVSERVTSAIRKVKAQGVQIAFATGRPTFSALSLMSDLGVDALSSFFSSALIFNPKEKKVVDSWPLNRTDLPGYISFLREEGFYLELYTANDYFVERTGEYTDLHLQYIHVSPKVCPFNEVIQKEDIVKVTAIVKRGDEEMRFRDVMKQFPSFHYGIATGASHDNIIFCNATNPNASREKVFKLIIHSLGIAPEEVMSFGDGESDMTFLSLAGMGVAMGNAADIVKKAANFVTLDVDEDGVAHALTELVLKDSAL